MIVTSKQHKVLLFSAKFTSSRREQEHIMNDLPSITKTTCLILRHMSHEGCLKRW